MRQLLPDLVLLLLLVLLPLLYFWRLFTPLAADRMTIVDGDFTQEFFPTALTIARAVQAGEWPLWNPFSNSGTPLLADPQNAFYYPLNWPLWLLLRGHDGASFQIFEATAVAHYAVAAVGGYLCGRVLVGARVGALVAGLGFAYSGFLASYPLQQLPILRAAVWLPWAVAALALACDRRSLAWGAACGAAVGTAALAGHPQTLLFVACVLAIYTAYRAGLAWRDGGARAACWPPGLLLLAAVVAGGLAAAQLLPTLEFMSVSNRAVATYAFTSGGFSPRELLLGALSPRLLGNLPAYSGLWTLVLAAVALRFGGRSVPFAAALAAFGLLVALGGNTFLHSALYNLVPGFDLFRNQERGIVIASFALALLAGHGAALLAAPLGRRVRPLRRLLLALLLALLGALVVGGVLMANWQAAELARQDARRWRAIVDGWALMALLLGLGCGLIWLRLAWRAARPLWGGLCVALLTLDLFSAGWLANLGPTQPNEIYRPSAIVQALQAAGWGRVADDRVLNGNHGLVYGLASSGESFALRLRRYDALRAALPPERALQILGARFLVTRKEPPPGAVRLLEEPYRDTLNVLYELPGALPPARVVGRALAASSPEEALELVGQAEFDPASAVVVEGLATDEQGGSGEASLRRLGYSALEGEANAPAGGWLVVGELAAPGWRAWVDGVETPLHVANGALSALRLPPGRHQVRLAYEPASARLGLAISALTLVLLLAGLAGRALTPRGRLAKVLGTDDDGGEGP